MMVFTAKLKKRNIIIVTASIIAILVLFLIPKNQENKQTETETLQAETNEDRIAYLTHLGWNVEQTPIETQDVLIPAQENEVFTRYNELQKQQGFDLTNYAGKTVQRYVYQITDETNNNCATLLVYKGKIIGGDVSSMDVGGKIQGLRQSA